MNEEKQNPSFVDSLVGDTKKGSDDAAALPDRLSRYAVAHQRALLMADYIKINKSVDTIKTKAGKAIVTASRFGHLPGLLNGCGDYLVFRDYFTVGKIKLADSNFCKKHLLCPFCATRRGAKMLKAYLDRLDVIRLDHPNIKGYLLTFTVKNGPDLLERFNHLQHSYQEYHVQRLNAIKGHRLPVEANKALGAVWSYEIKRGSGSDLFHPHLHAVWLCHEEPNQAQVRREWEAITGDSFIVDVTPFYDQDDVVSGFLEVFKYAVKFSDLTLEDNFHAFEVLSGKRLISSFGLFRGVVIPESMLDELLDDLPFIELFYQFLPGAGYSLKSASQPILKSLDEQKKPSSLHKLMMKDSHKNKKSVMDTYRKG